MYGSIGCKRFVWGGGLYLSILHLSIDTPPALLLDPGSDINYALTCMVRVILLEW